MFLKSKTSKYFINKKSLVKYSTPMVTIALVNVPLYFKSPYLVKNSILPSVLAHTMHDAIMKITLSEIILKLK